jgi:hypothetical protein
VSRAAKGEKTKKRGSFRIEVRKRSRGSVSHNHASVDLALAPVHPPSGQFVAGLERADVLLAIAGRLGVHRPDDFCAMAPVAKAMGYACVRAAEAMRRTLRIVAFVPGVTDQDELAADVACRKFIRAAVAVVELLSGRGGKPATGVGRVGHDFFHRASGWFYPTEVVFFPSGDFGVITKTCLKQLMLS